MILLLALTILLIPYIKKDNSMSDDFFYWIDGYVAFEENSQTSFALTYYYDKAKNHISNDKINRIEFIDADNISITNYTIAEMDFENDAKYSGYSITLDIKSNSIGIDQINYIKIYTDSNSYSIYPIGTWVFDIGPKEGNPDVLDTWSSPVASDNSNEFPYLYKLNSNNTKVLELWYGEKEYIKAINGIQLEGSIDISSNTAPVKYIKTKMVVENNNKLYTVYGKGCYCGAINTSDESVELSRQYSINNKY